MHGFTYAFCLRGKFMELEEGVSNCGFRSIRNEDQDLFTEGLVICHLGHDEVVIDQVAHYSCRKIL